MKKIITLLLFFVCLYSNAQTTCANAQPFCAGGTSGVTFPATTNQPDAFPSSYNCLGSSPNPAWYYLQVSNSGNLDLYIAGTGGWDVDFICWGPFTNLATICSSLSTSNVVDCSYSSSPTETCNIVGAVAGQYYMVLITNFSNVSQNIVFNQIGGTGSTNCGLLASNSTICAGSSATITANNASNLTNPSYSLNPGALTSPTPTFIVNPTTTTTYTVYVTGLNTSSVAITQTAVSTVTVKPQPSVAPTTTQSSCTNSLNAFNLGLTFNPITPVPNYTVNWSPTPFSVGNATQTTGSGGILAGLYNATITAAGGCSTTTSFSINPTPAPAVFNLVPAASVYTVTCAQPTVVINLNPASYNYTWTNGVSTPQNGSIGSFNSANQGTWTVVGTNPASGCTATHTFIVTQNVTVPTSSVTPLTQNITCNIASIITVTGTGTPTTNITHLWMSPAGGTVTSGVNPSPFLPGGVGTYTHCIVDNVNGCSSCSTFTVSSTSGYPLYTVSSPQQFTLGCGTTSMTTISINTPTTFPTAGGPVSYTLLPPSYAGPSYTLGGNPVFTINVPGTYTAIVHDNTNSCETTVQLSVISNTAAPSLTATAVQQTLTCYVPKTILQGASSTPNVSYTWLFPGIPGTTPNDTLTVFSNSNTAASASIIATYTLAVTDNINKCRATQTLNIYQNIAGPIPIITPSGSVAITCGNPTISLTNSSTPHPTSLLFPHTLIISADWGGPSPQQPEQFVTSYIASTPGTYTMFVTDLNNGCKTFTTKVVGDNRIYPIVNTPIAPGPFIMDCAAPGATIYPIVSPPTANLTYSWVSVPTASFSTQTASVTVVNKPGTYKIIVTNSTNSCVAYGVVEVINGGITANFNPNTTSGFAPLTVNFSNLSTSSSSTTGTSSITSAWSFGNGTSLITNSTGISPSTIYNNAGTYTVTLFVSKGSCFDTVSKVIVVDIPSKLDVPNVFTPNGDGSNDVFFLKVQNVTDINALIFDRWGNKVFETNSSTGNIEWDGKNMSGKEASVGTYFYIIKGTGKDGTEYDKKGNVSLYR